jgi:hypothetical protein
MSDTRTEAIHKAATELVEELLSAAGENGGERWTSIVTRKFDGWADPKLVKELRDILLRVRVLLEEDVDDLGPIVGTRHAASIEEIDRLLQVTKLPQ